MFIILYDRLVKTLKTYNSGSSGGSMLDAVKRANGPRVKNPIAEKLETGKTSSLRLIIFSSTFLLILASLFSDGFIRTNKIAKKPISYLLSYEISFVTEKTFL